MPEYESPCDVEIVPPPLFSPHVYIPEKHERCTFDSNEYTIEFSRFMVSDYDTLYPVLSMANKFNIPIVWKRVLEVLVHEAWALAPQVGFSVHDVRCKVAVGEQTGRTELSDPNEERKVIWDKSFKYQVGDPCDIAVLVYCKNTILPNDKLGRIWITPNQLVERKTVTEWFPLNTSGEIKLSITLSPPEITPFKFTFSKCLSVSSRDSHIYNESDEKIFTLIGKWPYSISLLDARSNSVLTFKNCINEPREREYTLYLYGQSSSTLTLTQTCGFGDSEFQIEGLPNIACVKTKLWDINFFSPSNTRVASAKLEDQKYYVEIHPGEDTIMILATIVLIAKLLLVEGQVIKEWSATLRSSSGSWSSGRFDAVRKERFSKEGRNSWRL